MEEHHVDFWSRGHVTGKGGWWGARIFNTASFPAPHQRSHSLQLALHSTYCNGAPNRLPFCRDFWFQLFLLYYLSILLQPPFKGTNVRLLSWFWGMCGWAFLLLDSLAASLHLNVAAPSCTATARKAFGCMDLCGWHEECGDAALRFTIEVCPAPSLTFTIWYIVQTFLHTTVFFFF